MTRRPTTAFRRRNHILETKRAEDWSTLGQIYYRLEAHHGK
jgi:hypothetical protein